MEQFIYAQLDENSICIGVSYLSGLVELPNMLRLNEEESVLGKKYNKGVWEEVEPPEPLPLPPPTDQEKILTALAQQKEENLTIMMAQADAYEAEQANSLTIMLALADLYEMGGVE